MNCSRDSLVKDPKKADEKEETLPTNKPTSQSSLRAARTQRKSVDLLNVPGIVVSFDSNDIRRNSSPNMRRKYSREMPVHYTELLRQMTLEKITSQENSEEHATKTRNSSTTSPIDEEEVESYTPCESSKNERCSGTETQDDKTTENELAPEEEPSLTTKHKVNHSESNKTKIEPSIASSNEENALTDLEEMENNKNSIMTMSEKKNNDTQVTVQIKERKVSDQEAISQSPLKALYEEAMNAVVRKDKMPTKNIPTTPTATAQVDQHTIDLSSVKSFDIRDNKVCRISGKRQTIFTSVTERRNHDNKRQPRSISMQVSPKEFSMEPRSKSLSDEILLRGIANQIDNGIGDDDTAMAQDCVIEPNEAEGNTVDVKEYDKATQENTAAESVDLVAKDLPSSSFAMTTKQTIPSHDDKEVTATTLAGDQADGDEETKEEKIPETEPEEKVNHHQNYTEKINKAKEELGDENGLDVNKNVSQHQKQHHQPSKNTKMPAEKQKLLFEEKKKKRQKKGDTNVLIFIIGTFCESLR